MTGPAVLPGRATRPHAAAVAKAAAERPRVLSVDDEPAVGGAITRVLRRDFTVVSATSAAQALALVRDGPEFAVVISDLQMPDIDGVSLLGHIRNLAPTTIRIMLTGRGSLETAVAAVNEGEIFRFLRKPVAPDLLEAVVVAAAEQHRMVTAERVLLEQTLRGTVKALVDVLALAQPEAFGRATRIKRLVDDLADELGLTDTWQLEVAAFLAQLGAVSIPPATLVKLSRGHPLSREEQEEIARVPLVSASLIEQIPRLEGVRDLLLAQATDLLVPANVRPGNGDTTASSLGAQILRLASDFDELDARAVPIATALELLAQRGSRYSTEVLEALGRTRGLTESGAAVREMTLLEVAEGMTFAADVTGDNGMLLVARGQEVTASLVLRIRNSWRDFAATRRVAIIATPAPETPAT